MPIQMFVKKNNNITVDVYVYQNKDGHIGATTEKQDIPVGLEPETISFVFKTPNYADSNMILGHFRNQSTVDFAAIQNITMHTMLVDWTLTDETGKKMNITKANIDALQPSVGLAAAGGYLSQIRF